MQSRNVSRRRFLAGTAAATAAVTVGPYIRTSHAAGKLEVGFWDHWVPGANDVLTKLCQEWAAKEKVDIKIDYIPSQGQKNLHHHRRRSAGEGRARPARVPDLAARGQVEGARAGRRRDEGADRGERRRLAR